MNNYGKVIRRTIDNSYVIRDGMYHVPNPNTDKTISPQDWMELWKDVNAYADAHPECVTEEQPYTPPVPTTEELAANVRAERDRRITATDYLVMPDYPLDTDKLEEIKAYRQALRDLPQQSGFPWGGPDDPECLWPVEP